MEFTLQPQNKRLLVDVKRDHHWYDPVQKQMLHGRGGEMYFVYDPKQRRMVPRLRDAKEWVYKKNFDEIEKWVKKKNFDVVNKVPNRSITINVPDILISDVEDDLYRHHITYDHD